MVLLLLFMLLPVTVFAAESGGIGGKPANPRSDNPRTESIFVYELSPGASVQDAVEIYNNTEEVKTIKVYPTDSVISSGGAFACAQAVDQVKDVGGWIKLAKDTVQLQPGKSEKINFMVSAPKTIEPGEHNGCIAIQQADTEAANVGNGIALSFRSAIRVAITIPGEITKELTIRDVLLAEKSDKLVGTILLRNNGNVSLDTTVTSNLQNIFGATVQTIQGTYPALPQTITELNFEYKKPYWGGLYKLVTTADYNANTAESLGEGSTSKSTKKSSRYVYITPAPIALLIQLVILGLLAAGAWYAWQRFVVLPKFVKGYVDYTVEDGDDIQTIASQSQTKWKHLAKANAIKAPYLLQEGQVIKVPKLPKKPAKQKTRSKKPVKKSRAKVKKED